MICAAGKPAGVTGRAMFHVEHCPLPVDLQGGWFLMNDNSAMLRPLGWTGPTGAKVIEHITVWSPLDNHTPTRNDATLTIERYEWPTEHDKPDDQRLNMPGGLDLFKRGAHALWLLDDGEDVRVYYSAGWHESKRYITLHPFPASMVGGFGPRHTYHLMVTKREGI